MELLNRVKAILLTPHTEWPVIAREKSDVSALFMRYVAILALIPALAHFIGTTLVGWYAPIWSSLAGALVTYLSGFAIVYVLALIIWLLPGLSFLVILGLHGVYLLWAGLPILMRVPAGKALPYTAVVAGCGFIIAVGLGLIEAPLFSAPG
jgi:hypothetical protein